MKSRLSHLAMALFLGTGVIFPSFAKAAGENATTVTPVTEENRIVDTLSFGNAASEASHAAAANASSTVVGGLGESSRVLLPQTPQSWQGGSVAFTMKVDPNKPNYFTIRLWGSENSPDRLLLFCEGKQIGYIHLGDIDILDFGNDSTDPPYKGRFYYNTSPLPTELTQGKSELHFEIRSIGPVWGYGNTFDKFQQTMTVPTRGIYRVYTHTEGFFVPPAGEMQGSVPAVPPVRTGLGPEVLDQLKDRVNHTIAGLLSSTKPLNQMQAEFLARAYHVGWTTAYQNPQVVPQVSGALDLLYANYKKDPKLMLSDPSTPNPDWFGAGPAGNAFWLLSLQLASGLDATIDDGTGAKVTRRAAWADLFHASVVWESRHRRQYSNQSMIVDMNIYNANKALTILDPTQAFPQSQVLHYLYQSVGLEPWLGSETDRGPSRPLGDNYWELTSQGLTKELGFVGYYGEVLDWVTQIYDATRLALDQPGDPRIEAQLVKIARARAVLRFPEVDADGNRAMRAETIVGWRDSHFPGNICYTERSTWDASTLYTAAATLDSELVGGVQQMFADNQFYPSVQEQMAQNNSLRVTAGLLGLPDQYALLQAQPARPKRLPMTDGQPDFVWADTDDGVVAIKHGNERVYASLYWRARPAINFLARVEDILPATDRIAVVREQIQFVPSGLTWTRPDWTIEGFANGGPKYPIELHSAEAGEQLPIAKVPDGTAYKPGDENPYAGRGTFYALRYGDYLIGMNTTKDTVYTLKTPVGVGSANDLSSGKRVKFTQNGLAVGPGVTSVLYFGH